MPPPQKNWPPVARLSLSDQNGRTVTISTEGTVPGRIGKNKRQAAVSQLASWELFWGDGSRNGDVGPPPLELEHTYDASQATAVIRLIVVDQNTLTATATMTITGLTGAPDAPQDVTLTVLGTTSIRVNWSDPSALSTSFVVERRLAGIGDFAIVASGITSTSFIDTGLTADTAYEYRVQGSNNVGSSTYSNTAAATTDPNIPPATPPAAPSALAANGTVFGQVTLTWTDNSSDETGFAIERALSGGSFTEIATVQADTVTYVDLTVAPSTAYQYRVRAFNVAGNSAYSNTANVTTAAPPIPAAPTNLVAVAQTTTSVLLTWTDNANNEANFELERRIGSQAFVRIITLAANLQTYLDPTAQPATIYSYRIRAINPAGTSAYSNIATATTPAAPPPDPPVVVLTPNATTIQVGTATILSTIGTHAGSAPLASYHLEWGDGFVEDANTAPPASFTRTYALPNPAAPSTFVPSLRVTDTNGLSATAFSPPITVNPPPVNPTVPAAPTNLVSALQALTTVRLNWTDNANNETGTKVERRVAPATFAQINTVSANVAQYDDAGRTPNTTYDYRVRAFNGVGDSPFSNVTSIFVPPASPVFFISLTGNDTTGTGTQINPWRTFARGNQALTPGATLYARGGSYAERIASSVSGTSWSAKVRIANFVGETVTLTPPGGNDPLISLQGSEHYIEFDGINVASDLRKYAKFTGTTHHIRMMNAVCTLSNSLTGDESAIHLKGVNTGHELINLDISGRCATYAIYVDGGIDYLIDGCSLHAISFGAVHIYTDDFPGHTPTRITVRNTRVYDITTSMFNGVPDTRAFGLFVSGNDCRVYNNLIHDNPFSTGGSGNKAGLVQFIGQRNKYWNNTVVNMPWRGATIDPQSSDTEMRNNIFWRCASAISNSGVNTQQSNNLLNNSDPLFANEAARDYQLRLGSPAIDTAVTIPGVAAGGMPPVDLLGVSRPQGAAWDRGCYERVF